MIDENIKKLLDDLYEIDPGLKARENDLIIIINELAGSRPDTKFDNRFKEELRRKMDERILAVKEKEKGGFFLMFNNMNKIYITIGGTALVLVIVLTSVAFGLKGYAPIVKKNANSLAFAPKVTSTLARGAFDFSKITAQESAGPAYGKGGGGGSASAPATQDAKLSMPYSYPTYEFVYNGQELQLPEGQLDVYKKVKGENPFNTEAVVSSLGFTGIDLSKLSNLRLDGLTFFEDREYGYMLSISTRDDSFSLNENWDKWPHPEQQCKDDACYQSIRLKPENMPSDEEAVSITDKFLADYGISLDGYGKGVVQDDWRRMYEVASDKSSVYIPDYINVVYPLIINDKKVYDESGSLYGISVSIKVRDKKVSGVWNLSSRNYAGSAYDVETDKAKITDYAKKGGWGWYMGAVRNAPGEDALKIELGQPEIVYQRIWMPEDNNPQGSEYIVPAYIFPVEKLPEGSGFWGRNITVPIIKDMLDKRIKQFEGNQPTLMVK